MAFVLASSLFSSVAFRSFQTADVTSVVENTTQRLKSFPELSHWQASVLSRKTEMDKNWKPKKKTEVEKIVKVMGEDRIEEILRATEIKNGKSKDVTKKQIKEARKRREKALKERAKRRAKGDSGDNGDSRELSMEEMFPFSPEKRKDYDFILLEDTSWAGAPVLILESKAKIRSDKFYEGKYFISKSDLYERAFRYYNYGSKTPFVKENYFVTYCISKH